MKALPLLLKSRILISLSFFVMGISLYSCEGNGSTPEIELPTESGDMVEFYKTHKVTNWYVKVNFDDSQEGLHEHYYSLEYGKERDRTYQKTDLWDISFSNMLNSFLGANNGKSTSSYGSGGPGQGGILILEEAFEDVIDIPSDTEFKTGKDEITNDGMGDMANDPNDIGWYIYDWEGTIMGDGSPDKQHTTYALGNPMQLGNGSDSPLRTIVVRTAQGNYAKVKIISCYKDAETQDKMVKDAPKMYYTFEYTLVPKESTKFIKE